MIVAKTRVLGFALLALSACSAGSQNLADDVDPRGDAAVEARATDLLRRAAAIEPRVSAQLLAVGRGIGGANYEMNFSLKPRKSLISKIRRRLKADPKLKAANVVIEDVLRYTLVVNDDPPGRYVDLLKWTLVKLRGIGHRTAKLLNYWPKGDYYDGVDAVLITPEAMAWELQLHTVESLMAREANDSDYSTYKREDTSPQKKRELYDLMAMRAKPSKAPYGVLPSMKSDKEQVMFVDRP